METSVRKKAELIETGGVVVDGSFKPYISRATAGPGAGLESIFVNIGGHRVRLGVRKQSKFSASLNGRDVTISDDSGEFARGTLEEAISHCPKQVYITVSERCIYDCKFCPVPKLQGKIKSMDEILEMVRHGLKDPSLSAISITSGVWKTPQEEAERISGVVKAIRGELGKRNVPIGVSIYPTENSSELLKEAGTAEVKYNIETVDPVIFKKVCPGLSQEYIIKSLEHAVSLYGKGHVFSNILIGLGESDETVVNGVEMLAGKGVIPILRKVNPHPLRAGEIEVEKVTADRLLKLGAETRRILEKHGLHAEQALTGCLPCTGCDITPVLDI
jgi:biotin synthase-related radical SAM superfamily protein